MYVVKKVKNINIIKLILIVHIVIDFSKMDLHWVDIKLIVN